MGKQRRPLFGIASPRSIIYDHEHHPSLVKSVLDVSSKGQRRPRAEISPQRPISPYERADFERDSEVHRLGSKNEKMEKQCTFEIGSLPDYIVETDLVESQQHIRQDREG